MRIAFLLLVSLLVLSGCEDDAPEALDYGPILQSWTGRGIYLGTRFEGQAAGIEHEAIPGFMDAMKMDFLLTSPEVVEGLEPGSKVTFTVIDTEEKVLVNRIEPLPDTTTLLLRFGPTPPPDSTSSR